MNINEARPPHVRFEYRAEEDRNASIEEGKTVFKNVAYAVISPVGGKDCVEKAASDWLQDIRRKSEIGSYNPEWVGTFERMFEMFQRDEEIPENGTPIKECLAFSPAEMRQIMSASVRTLEDLAQANEETIGRMGMGARALKERAVNMLSQDGKAARKLEALQVENDELKARLTKLEERLAQADSDKPRRGRPPKGDE